MGPILDKWGVEQGGRNSSELYKVFNNCQLEIAQSSKLGVPLGACLGPGSGDDHGDDQDAGNITDSELVVSAIGQADDVALVSNDIFSLQCLLHLSLQYCKQHHVQLRADKTKLQVFSNKNCELQAYLARASNPIKIDGEVIEFVD